MSIHKTLDERWAQMPLAEQMGNIGSEVSRATLFYKKGDAEKCFNAVARGLELIDLSLSAAQKANRKGALKELSRAREFFCEIFLGNNYTQEIQSFQEYFDQFAIASRR